MLEQIFNGIAGFSVRDVKLIITCAAVERAALVATDNSVILAVAGDFNFSPAAAASIVS